MTDTNDHTTNPNCPDCGKPLWWLGVIPPPPGTVCECNIKINPTGMTGWICPKCGAGVAPFASTCPCNFNYTVTSTNIRTTSDG